MTSLSSIKKLGFAISLIVWLFSCGGGKTAPSQAEGDTLAFKYATQLSVVRYDGYTVATLKNPWKEGMTLHQYVLVPKNQVVPKIPGATIIRTPLSRSMMFSTVHCAMLMDFGKQDCISGVADLKYIKIPWIQKQVRRGKISDCGDGMSPVIEKIIDIHPDAILLSPFENSGGYGKLEDLDIPLVECAEYMEVSPLARAEWMRFYGLLFGKQKKADKLFAEVDESYNDLKQEAEEAGEGRSVMMDKLVGSVWYVPGGRSTIGQMIKDAGGRYPWEDDEHSGSLPLSFETVLEEAFDTEVWMFRYEGDKPISFGQFGEEKNGYQQFRAYQTQEVYGCNVRTSRFYEESPFHPDWLLNDFIHILHPDVKLKSPLKYYKKLN
jgi:iron complex transport system substrate-binding protein